MGRMLARASYHARDNCVMTSHLVCDARAPLYTLITASENARAWTNSSACFPYP
jgi:hypothetical protein